VLPLIDPRRAYRTPVRGSCEGTNRKAGPRLMLTILLIVILLLLLLGGGFGYSRRGRGA
jgi:hypothetical protein